MHVKEVEQNSFNGIHPMKKTTCIKLGLKWCKYEQAFNQN
jgi:hypothetical protein